ncbi:SET and MYND domain-containing protein 5 [Ixodes scapularis]|uniref:SET and MYND domain-containing protein 5 n=1 Tax=Ixodes scapularis TaxID=6945 RepID=UPI001A9E3E01|nr:SET and MYND domain-containing protein 5 [Ixodes scapularis]
MDGSVDLEVRSKGDGSKVSERLFSRGAHAQGDVLLVESPLASVQFAWNRACRYAACDLCLRPLETAEENVQRLAAKPGLRLPWPQCCSTRPQEHVSCPACQVLYCSDACRARAWALHHRVLCTAGRDPPQPLERLTEAWKELHHPPETTSVLLAVRLLARMAQAEDGAALATALGRLTPGLGPREREDTLARLLGPEWRDRLALLRRLILDVFQGHPRVGQWTAPEDFELLVALLVKRGQSIGTSALSVWARNVDELELPPSERAALDSAVEEIYDDIERESGVFLNNEGCGLYPLQSLCAHSCCPNAEARFLHNDHTLSLVALRDIRPGEEVTVSYIDECSLSRSRHSRIKMLRESHLFTCTCPRCEEEATQQPDVTSDEEMEDSSDAEEACS